MITEAVYLLSLPFIGAGVFFAIRSLVFRDPEAGHHADGAFAIVSVLAAVYNMLEGEPLVAGLFAVSAVWLAWEWWRKRKRKRRDPAARTLGAKSKARLAALVAKARGAARPRPVLRPVPGGVS